MQFAIDNEIVGFTQLLFFKLFNYKRTAEIVEKKKLLHRRRDQP